MLVCMNSSKTSFQGNLLEVVSLLRSAGTNISGLRQMTFHFQVYILRCEVPKTSKDVLNLKM